MTTVLSYWTQFAACALLVGLAGPVLSRCGDIIADKTGLSGDWIGVILLATVTSLPELITGVTAVTVAQVPNIAVGDVLGSCVFNLAILVILDFLHRGESVYQRAHQGHILSAGFGIVLIGFVGLNLLITNQGLTYAIGHVGLYTPIIVALYALSVRSVFTYERREMEQFAEKTTDRYPEITLRTATKRFAAASVVVVVAGVWLPFVGADLADAMQWNRSFMGTLFVAGVTSLPEVVVTIAALRIGALDMAIANLLGSNLFNILILAIDDMLYVEGPLLAKVAPAHAASAASAVIMTGIVVVGLLYRPAARLFRTVGWVSFGLFIVYLLNTYVLYLHGG
ncbi:MAG TPA: sodium:calcium antiporter [Alphaproteobacteria bacterium]|nr:sodium:calcium antiporter [Alphaproteobacteria bacterium]